MLSTETQTATLPITKYMGRALVLEIDEFNGLILLQVEDNAYSENEVWAESALPINHEFTLGETILCLSENYEKFYIIGILGNNIKSKTYAKVLTLQDGTSAKIEKKLDSEKLQLNSKSGELIFEYDAKSEKSIVKFQSGDLEIVTAKGKIDFISEGDINFLSKQSVKFQSNQEIKLQTANSIGQNLSSISLINKKIKMSSSDLNISSQRGQFYIHNTKYIGNEFSGRIKNVKIVMTKLESIANTVLQKAENIYQSVKDLSQLKTGRMRTLVDSTFHLKGKKVFIKAEEDFKVKGEKIHLG
jgi:Protein of unknown function (DUF3540)